MRKITYSVIALTVVILLIVSPLFLGVAQQKRMKADERDIDCQNVSTKFIDFMIRNKFKKKHKKCNFPYSKSVSNI
jgi:hypothetical protein